jgi:hypothetical protein
MELIKALGLEGLARGKQIAEWRTSGQFRGDLPGTVCHVFKMEEKVSLDL